MSEIRAATDTKQATPATRAADEVLDGNAEERRNVRHMIRWISGFIAWPALSISFAMMLEFEEHALHIFGLLPLGIAALVLFFMAPRLAARFVPPEA